MYTACTATPRTGPRLAAVSTTARVCPVTGTGEPGTGTETWASRAVNSTPIATRTTFRARTAGTRSARTNGRVGNAGTEAVAKDPPGGRRHRPGAAGTRRVCPTGRRRPTGGHGRRGGGGQGSSWGQAAPAGRRGDAPSLPYRPPPTNRRSPPPRGVAGAG